MSEYDTNKDGIIDDNQFEEAIKKVQGQAVQSFAQQKLKAKEQVHITVQNKLNEILNTKFHDDPRQNQRLKNQAIAEQRRIRDQQYDRIEKQYEDKAKKLTEVKKKQIQATRKQMDDKKRAQQARQTQQQTEQAEFQDVLKEINADYDSIKNKSAAAKTSLGKYSTSVGTKEGDSNTYYENIIKQNFITKEKGNQAKQDCSILSDYPWTMNHFVKKENDSFGNGNLLTAPVPHCYLVQFKQKYSSNITNYINTLVAAAGALTDESTSTAMLDVTSKVGSLLGSLLSAIGLGDGQTGNSIGKIANKAITTGTDVLASLLGFLGGNPNGAVENNIRTSNLLRPYSLLYWLAPTHKRYVFPMISQPPVNKVHNDFGDKKQQDSSGLMNNSFINKITGFAEMIPGLVRDFKDLSHLVGGSGSHTYELSQVEKSKFFNYPTNTEQYSISFPLYNTVRPKSGNQPVWKQNYKFILLFTLRNMIFRRDNSSFFPPLFYDLIIPGVIRQPFTYVSDINVKPVGVIRMLSIDNPLSFLDSNTKLSVAVPQVWVVTIKVKSLLATSANMVLSGLSELSINSQVSSTVTTQQSTSAQ